jgi:UDPglucose 6-dehydrogenase
MNPDRIIIGQCCKEHAEKLVSLYAPLEKPIFITDPTTSEAAKLLSNSYLAMLITFWNEASELAEKRGLNIHEVAELVRADSRVSAYGTSKFGQPFGGKCLPSNLDQLINAFRSAGLNPLLFEAVKKYNQRLQR